MALTSAVFNPGSKSSSSTSYGWSAGGKKLTYCRLSAITRSRWGRNAAKSFLARASLHACWAAETTSACSATNVAGTCVAFR